MFYNPSTCLRQEDLSIKVTLKQMLSVYYPIFNDPNSKIINNIFITIILV